MFLYQFNLRPIQKWILLLREVLNRRRWALGNFFFRNTVLYRAAEWEDCGWKPVTRTVGTNLSYMFNKEKKTAIYVLRKTSRHHHSTYREGYRCRTQPRCFQSRSVYATNILPTNRLSDDHTTSFKKMKPSIKMASLILINQIIHHYWNLTTYEFWSSYMRVISTIMLNDDSTTWAMCNWPDYIHW